MQSAVRRIEATGISSKIYTAVIAFLPVFATYASGIAGFSLADVILVAFTGYAFLFFRKSNKNVFTSDLTMLFVGIALIFFIDIIAIAGGKADTYDIVIRTVRYFFYVFCFWYTSKRMIEPQFLQSCVKNVSVAATVYIFLQFVLYKLFNYVLKGFFDFMELYVSEYADQDYVENYAQMYRPTSFFLEPAHFARYAVLGVVVILWRKDLRLKDIFLALFVSLGVLLSTSANGYALLALVWLVFALTRTAKIKNRSARLFVVFCILVSPILLVLIFRIPFVEQAIVRILSGDMQDDNTAIGARLGGFAEFLKLSVFNKIFGMGFGMVPDGVWLSSAAYWLYGSGVIVFAVYILFMLKGLKKLKGVQKIVFLLFFVLFFTDDVFYSYMCVLFYSVSMIGKKEINENKSPQMSGKYSLRLRHRSGRAASME